MTITITCNLTDADYRAFRRHVLFRYRKIHWLYGALLVLILSHTWFGGNPEETVRDKIHFLIGLAFMFGGLAITFLFVFWFIGRFIRRVDETRQHFFVISSTGIGHIIPKRELQSTDALRALQSRATKGTA